MARAYFIWGFCCCCTCWKPGHTTYRDWNERATGQMAIVFEYFLGCKVFHLPTNFFVMKNNNSQMPSIYWRSAKKNPSSKESEKKTVAAAAIDQRKVTTTAARLLCIVALRIINRQPKSILITTQKYEQNNSCCWIGHCRMCYVCWLSFRYGDCMRTEKKGETAEPTKKKNRIIKHHTNIHKMNVRSKNSVCFNNGMRNAASKTTEGEREKRSVSTSSRRAIVVCECSGLFG